MTGVLTPDEVIERLRQGNQRWASDESRHPHLSTARRVATAVHGQDPIACVLTCSDSRVAPEQLMDVGVGDLFTIRVAGNVVSQGVRASAEYAALRLRTPLFLVLGHSHCGAVSAAMESGPLPSGLDPVLDEVRPSVQAVRRDMPDADADAVARAVAEHNARRAVDEMLRTCPAVRELAEAGRTRVMAAVYHLASGLIDWLGQSRLQSGTVSEPLAGNRKN